MLGWPISCRHIALSDMQNGYMTSHRLDTVRTQVLIAISLLDATV